MWCGDKSGRYSALFFSDNTKKKRAFKFTFLKCMSNVNTQEILDHTRMHNRKSPAHKIYIFSRTDCWKNLHNL